MTANLGIGSLLWGAPELFGAERLSPVECKAADVYSFGIVLYEIMTQRLPYEHITTQKALRAAKVSLEICLRGDFDASSFRSE